ncbi:MAG TPA: HD domain-containing phosphohydrolase [Baekduia sp.]|nr:HD domain-containing phosphohydrolase [Baekduia sp.]
MATVVLLVAVVAPALALVFLVRRAERGAARRALDAAKATAARERERLEGELGRVQETLTRHTEMLSRAQSASKAEREWSRELRSQIARIKPERTSFEGHGDVRELVLEAAIKLAEGDRGLLLSREDEDDDGQLDLVASLGFTHDPRHSAIAQRFAREVLERDQIVRQDAPTAGGQRRAPADDEIASLVAIPLYLRDHFHGVVVCANRPGGFDDVADDVLLALGDHAGAALQHGQLRHQVRDAHRASVRVLVEAVAAQDPVLHRESSRLAVLAIHLAHELGLDEGDRDVLVCAVLLRGVGHLALPERLLHKPGPLTSEERALVDLHPRIGFNVISQAPVLRHVATTVLYHHERWDGGGYPAGLAGTDIPLLARVVAILEAYGSMTHERSFRDARSSEEACQALVDAAGTQFDPEITQVFVENVRRSAGSPSDTLAESVLEALPFDPVAAADSTLGPLGGPATDGLTLLGDHRALQRGVRDAVHAAEAGGRPFAMVMVQIERLSELNADATFLVGDRVIHVAARNVRRVAVRVGGTGYRASGRRLAILAPLRDDLSAERIAEEVALEFAGGPAARHAVVVWESGESGEALIARARDALAST